MYRTYTRIPTHTRHLTSRNSCAGLYCKRYTDSVVVCAQETRWNSLRYPRSNAPPTVALINQAWGQIPAFRNFSSFSKLSENGLPIEYHFQLSCCDTCQIWMWFKHRTCWWPITIGCDFIKFIKVLPDNCNVDPWGNTVDLSNSGHHWFSYPLPEPMLPYKLSIGP